MSQEEETPTPSPETPTENGGGDGSGAPSAEADESGSPAGQSSGADDAAAALHKSALQDNIDRKGKNAYYYAHGHRVDGPKWDGKPEPKLLGRTASDVGGGSGGGGGDAKTSSFHYHKSNITSYAFADEPGKVRLYIDLPSLSEKCPSDDDVTLTHDSTSFCLVARNYPEVGSERCLSFGRLHGPIEKATFRKKENRIVLTLTKAEEAEWPGVAARGDPEREVV